MKNVGKISNCKTSVSVDSDTPYVGGLVGVNYGTITDWQVVSGISRGVKEEYKKGYAVGYIGGMVGFNSLQ